MLAIVREGRLCAMTLLSLVDPIDRQLPRGRLSRTIDCRKLQFFRAALGGVDGRFRPAPFQTLPSGGRQLIAGSDITSDSENMAEAIVSILESIFSGLWK